MRIFISIQAKCFQQRPGPLQPTGRSIGMKQQFVCDAGGKKLGSRIIGAVPHRFSALSGRQTFAADIDLPAAWLLQPRQRHGKVVLPAPFLPVTAVICPAGRAKFRFSKMMAFFRLQVRFLQKRCSSPALAGSIGREISVSAISRRPYRFRSSSESSLICAGVFSHWIVPSDT